MLANSAPLLAEEGDMPTTACTLSPTLLHGLIQATRREDAD